MHASDLFSARSVAFLMAICTSLMVFRVSTAAQTNQPHEHGADLPAAGDVLKKPLSAGARAANKEGETAERINALEDALRVQNAKLEAMEKLISRQQQMIEALVGKASAVPNDATATVAATPTTAAQAPPLDERVKKLEGQVARIGPFRLSGDFRLRFDAILRKADNNPPAGLAPLTHQQNVRMRYRFRLNLDTDINEKLSFHSQLATGPLNNPLTNDQDFGSVTTRHPFMINEAWVEYRANKATTLQGGRVLEIFADNSRFLFDDDVRFNGFNEKYTFAMKENGLKLANIEFRAGQYIFSNPNVAIVTAGSPLASAGAIVGTTGRNSNLFHQGLLFNQQFDDKWSSQFGGDVQFYRNPNQIQLASTAAGVPLIVQNGLGIALSGPLTGTGNATTTPGGAIYSARNFEIARITYNLKWAGSKGCKVNERTKKIECDNPVTFNFQAARNMGIGPRERDAFLAMVQYGRVSKRGDKAFTYIYSQKGANALISQLTDDDLGTNSGVNIRTNHFRFDYGLAKKVTLQSLLFVQRELRNSGDFPNFFVPLNAFTPRQYRFQEQIVFNF
jgi:hypothetical protein